ncbi:minor capsid protein [Corallococcus sp. bb12-1]|uniref:minor capsid protein n=1 Tax=Corallococcus sp. bb12-1 TaxID=2996784 RepID=UPI002271CD10|nr:minor capsid protein [Corallococcus sp. bb12-1]MCY1043335.1 minor capsid protein [Corallococcus sp. bb12-1]
MGATLKDVELHVAQVLEGAALGVSMTAAPPSLYTGPWPVSAPPQVVAVREVNGDAPEDYLGTGRSYLQPDVQVLVRGLTYAAAQALARRCWSALHLAAVPGYVSCRAQGAPAYMGPDGKDHHRFAFTVTLAYAG